MTHTSTSKRTASLEQQLRALLGVQAVLSAPDALRTYDADASMIVAHSPQLVALPIDSAQAASVVRLARTADMPVVARGAGTGIAGGAVPLCGGVVLSTARMDRVVQLDVRNRRATVQPGVVNGDLNTQLAPLGFQFAPDPSSQRASTIGGNLATNAGGPHCLKYGVTSNHVLAVELVLRDGTLLWTGDGLPDAGYDITGLIVGSEGTLGVVTQAIVRLTPLPEANRVVLALFPGVVQASAAVSAIIAAGHLPTSLEVMDANAIRAVNDAYGLGLPAAATALIVEVDGVADGLDATLAEVLDLCRRHAAFELRPARTAAEQARVWAARKSVAGAIGRLAPAYYLIDTVVPRTRLPLMMEHVERLCAEHGLPAVNVFHAGDGNLHPLVLYDPRDADQVARAHAIGEAVLSLSIAQGGVISGEHGIGLEKQEYLPLLFTREELQVYAAMYTLFNPDDGFNPAKIFPRATAPQELAAQRMRRIVASFGSERGTTAQLLATLAALIAPNRVEMLADGVSLYARPGTREQFAAAVAAAHRAGLSIRPWHSNHAPLPAESACLYLATRCLDRVLVYEPDDQTIQVEAGTTLAELRAVLARNHQIFPLDVADAEHETLAALIARAADGPRQAAYGALRDLVLGLTVVECDGTIVRYGAQVVKNVTGYNLVKLMVGSRDTLGLIVAVSLRVFPRPPQSTTLVLGGGFKIQDSGRRSVTDHAVFARYSALLDALAATRLQPAAVNVLADGEGAVQLVLKLEGSSAVVDRHRREIATLAAQHGVDHSAEFNGKEEEQLWWQVLARSSMTCAADEALLRIAVLPGQLAVLLADLSEQSAHYGLSWQCDARTASGLIYLRLHGAVELIATVQAAFVARWKHSHILAGPAALLAHPQRWGASLPTAQLNQQLKAAFDPFGTLPPH